MSISFMHEKVEDKMRADGWNVWVDDKVFNTNLKVMMLSSLDNKG